MRRKVSVTAKVPPVVLFEFTDRAPLRALSECEILAEIERSGRKEGRKEDEREKEKRVRQAGMEQPEANGISMMMATIMDPLLASRPPSLRDLALTASSFLPT